MLKRYLNFFIIIAILALPVAVFAAWRDAPAAAPNYGAVSPDTQADYKPMNLGSTDQIKSGGAQFATDVGKKVKIGDYVFVNNDKLGVADNSSSGSVISAYQQGSGYAVYSSGGMNYFGGNVGIAQTAPTAKLAVNNPTAVGKVGSLGDSIYAYASSTNAAISAEQGNNAGYAIYASGKSAFMSGNVGIKTLNPQAALHVIGATRTDGGLEIRSTAAYSTAQSMGTEYWAKYNIAGSQTAVATIFGRRTSTADNSYDGELSFLTRETGFSQVEAMRINKKGFVGIGTASPQDKLDVEGGSIVVNRYTGNANSGLYLSSTIGPTHYNWRITAQDTVSDALEFGPSSAPGVTTWATTPTMVIKQNGNVGIGITTPAYKLDVAGTVNVSQLCFAGGNCQSSGWLAGGPLIIENRAGDPVGPVTGRMWLITP